MPKAETITKIMTKYKQVTEKIIAEYRQKGWRIEFDSFDQSENDSIYYQPGEMITYTSYVYPPGSDDFIVSLNQAGFTSLDEAKIGVAKQLKKYY